MIQNIKIQNYGPIKHLQWPEVSSLNLIIGKNCSGKTFLLKILYSAIKTIEETGRGDNPKSVNEILEERLYWTFQVDRIGELVHRSAIDHLLLKLNVSGKIFSYEFSKAAERKISNMRNEIGAREANSVFLPAKEVLSIFHVIKKSRDIDKIFGFDDTYRDLVMALEIEMRKGDKTGNFSSARKELEKIVNGKMVYKDNIWYYQVGNIRYPIHTTAEGIKKISILDRLLANRYLDNQSIIFIDEPEAALHPTALVEFLDVVAALSDSGIQIFLATHSYFVIKKLTLIASEKAKAVPVLSFVDDGAIISDLMDGMPDNPIIDESIRLYEQEIDLALK